MTSYVNVLRQMATTACDKAEDAVDFLDKNALVLATIGADNTIRQWPPLIVVRPQLIQGNVAQIKFVLPLLRRVIELDRTAVKYMGDPDELRRVARALSGADEDSAGARIKDLRDTINPNYLPTRLSWEGRTADAYRLYVGDQPGAVEAVLEPINTMAEVLHSVAQGIEDFYVALAGAAISLSKVVIDLVVAILGAVAAGTGIGIAVAALGIVSAILDIAAALLALATTFLNTQHENEDQLIKLGPSLPGKWLKPLVGDGPPGG